MGSNSNADNHKLQNPVAMETGMDLNGAQGNSDSVPSGWPSKASTGEAGGGSVSPQREQLDNYRVMYKVPEVPVSAATVTTTGATSGSRSQPTQAASEDVKGYQQLEEEFLRQSKLFTGSCMANLTLSRIRRENRRDFSVEINQLHCYQIGNLDIYI